MWAMMLKLRISSGGVVAGAGGLLIGGTDFLDGTDGIAAHHPTQHPVSSR
jgi:hypothetical protein